MDDYINRQAFIEDIKTEILNLSMDGMKGTHRPHDELYGFIERIEEQPSADVRHVVRGRWRWVGQDQWNDCYECSQCGKMNTDNSNFCPNCGAMMMEE